MTENRTPVDHSKSKPLDARSFDLGGSKIHWFPFEEVNPQELEVFLHAEEKASAHKLKSDSRKLEFMASRALMQSLGLVEGAPINKGTGGMPKFPEGFMGSISHTSGRVFVVIEPDWPDDAYLGLDVEAISRFQNLEIPRKICTPKELHEFNAAPQPHHFLAMLFSAKEAIFKALYPSVRQTFWFPDAELEGIEAEEYHSKLTFKIAPRLKTQSEVSVVSAKLRTSSDFLQVSLCRPG